MARRQHHERRARDGLRQYAPVLPVVDCSATPQLRGAGHESALLVAAPDHAQRAPATARVARPEETERVDEHVHALVVVEAPEAQDGRVGGRRPGARVEHGIDAVGHDLDASAREGEGVRDERGGVRVVGHTLLAERNANPSSGYFVCASQSQTRAGDVGARRPASAAG